MSSKRFHLGLILKVMKESQRSFTRQIRGLEGLDYAERLEKLKKPMYSIQRRNERFKILYIYKIKEEKVPNISSKNGLTFSMHVRRGCRCNMPTFPIRGKAKNARDRSFAWTACNLWNSLPRCVRDISGEKVEVFKRKLDKILAFYPDEPRCAKSGNTFDRYGHRSNSL